MKERPIIFNDAMVRAIYTHRKTQTRGPVRMSGTIANLSCPYGDAGDRLWVREAWRLSTTNDCACYEPCHCKSGVPMFRADSSVPEDDGPWKPSVHMPRAHARLILEITEVRIQRLQDISEADAELEGFGPKPDSPFWKDRNDFARQEFKGMWDTIYRSWVENQFVWVITFTVVTP